jgi:A/G-specific adenine glycosylase
VSAARRAALLRWYDAQRRDLPWRRTRDPWAIWISEAMLQQTRVETVIPYYERFLRRFPDVASLARAELDEVLGHWAGLGYYSRARHLKRAAELVMDRFAGEIPDEPARLRELPGVGRYTAGAVASIAFGRPEPVLDGNAARVLARLGAIRGDPSAPRTRERLWQEAARLARGPRPGDLNQALMELGARVCTPRRPRCELCPLARGCRARRAGDPEALPRRRRRPRPRLLRGAGALLWRRGRALAVRRPERGLLGGLWELPWVELCAGAGGARHLARELGARLGVAALGLEPAGRVEHALSHRRLELCVFVGRAGPGRVRLRGWDAHRWLAPDALAALPQGRAARKALALALTYPRPRG